MARAPARVLRLEVGRLAQSVEHHAHIVGVAGSSPAATMRKIKPRCHLRPRGFVSVRSLCPNCAQDSPFTFSGAILICTARPRRSMRPNLDTWNVVLSGEWNVRIFKPQWTVANLFNGEQTDVSFILTAGIQHLRYRSPSVTLLPKDDRLIIGPRHATKASMGAAVNVAKNVLKLLPHTPLSACGVNFGFESEELPDSLGGTFDLADHGVLVEAGCQVDRVSPIFS